jgi:hypothetical protein
MRDFIYYISLYGSDIEKSLLLRGSDIRKSLLGCWSETGGRSFRDWLLSWGSRARAVASSRVMGVVTRYYIRKGGDRISP